MIMDTTWVIVEDFNGKVVHEEPYRGRSHEEVDAALEAEYPVGQYRHHFVMSSKPSATPAEDGWHKGWDTDALRGK